MKLRRVLWNQAQDGDLVRFVFDQVRNLALIGVVIAAGFYCFHNAFRAYFGVERWFLIGIGTLVFAFAVWLLFLEHWYIINWIEQRKLPKWAEFLLRKAMIFVMVGIVGAAVRYSPSPTVFL